MEDLIVSAVFIILMFTISRYFVNITSFHCMHVLCGE